MPKRSKRSKRQRGFSDHPSTCTVDDPAEPMPKPMEVAPTEVPQPITQPLTLAFDGGIAIIAPSLQPTGTYEDFVEIGPTPEQEAVLAGQVQPTVEGVELPSLLPDRLTKWLDRSPHGPIGDIHNALVEQGWTVHGYGGGFIRAVPPGVPALLVEQGSPWVPLPASLDSPREVANLVATLKHTGSFEWSRG